MKIDYKDHLERGAFPIGALFVVGGLYIIISIVVIAVDFLEIGIQISVALFSGIAFIAVLFGGVRLSMNQKQEKIETQEEVAATKDKDPFMFRMNVEEKFFYTIIAFIFGGWFLASFTPQANTLEAYKIIEWRIFMLVSILVIYIFLFVYFRKFSRMQE